MFDNRYHCSSSRSRSAVLPCQLNESKLNMTNWTEQLNKKPVKRKSTGQQQLNKKRFEQFVNWVKQFWQKSQLNIFLIEQKSNWTSNYWTSSQLNNMPTEHWTSENWSSFNWTFYIWTETQLNTNKLNIEQLVQLSFVQYDYVQLSFVQ